MKSFIFFAANVEGIRSYFNWSSMSWGEEMKVVGEKEKLKLKLMLLCLYVVEQLNTTLSSSI